jgi:hypothetical protein
MVYYDHVMNTIAKDIGFLSKLGPFGAGSGSIGYGCSASAASARQRRQNLNNSHADYKDFSGVKDSAWRKTRAGISVE